MIYLVTTQLLPESICYKIISPEEALEKLQPLKKVGLDTETEGLDPYTKKLLMVQLGCYDFQVVIDCTTIDIQFFKEYLESDRLFIGWNIKFDVKFLMHQRIIVRQVYDGFIAEKLLWLGYPSGMHSMSLKSAGINYLDIELDKSVRGRIIYGGLSDEVIAYGANDVRFLEKIMDLQLIELQKKNLITANIYEQKFVPCLAYTEYCGVKLDVERWKRKMELDKFNEMVFLKALDDWVVASVKGEKYSYHYLQIEGEEEVEKKRKKMKGEREPSKDIKGKRGYMEAYKVPIEIQLDKSFIIKDLQGDLFSGFSPEKCAVNWSSPKQVISLFKALGFDLRVKDDDTGEFKDSVESKVIKPQSNISSIAYLYLQYKAASKLTSTYGQNVIDQINPVSGRIHTNFNQLGTDTGRLSSGGTDDGIEHLNFQNFPHDPETRACFISDVGNKWISCDYSGQESRIIAYTTNDAALLDLFNNGCGDVHSLVAKMSYPDIIGDCPVEEIKEKFHQQRQDAKGIEFAINYGGNDSTIANNSGIPINEAKQIYDNYMKGFKGMKNYQDRQRKFVMKNGYILLNPFSLHKSYIYDWEVLVKAQKRFTSEFWNEYRAYKGMQQKLPKAIVKQIFDNFSSGLSIKDCTGVYYHKDKAYNIKAADVYVWSVKHFFKRKTASEKQAINYPCQGTGAVMFKTASIFLWEYLLRNNLLYKVKLCIPAHDEWNIEVPEELTNEMTNILQKCMSDAGEFFCNTLPMPADAEVGLHWIH